MYEMKKKPHTMYEMKKNAYNFFYSFKGKASNESLRLSLFYAQGSLAFLGSVSHKKTPLQSKSVFAV